MISAPARIGIANRIRMAVIKRAHVESGIRNQVIPGARILITVEI